MVALGAGAVPAAPALAAARGPARLATPPVTRAERAVAIVTPALVTLTVTWEGWVLNRVTGALLDDQSVTITQRCGGVGVSSDGYLITAGQCVDVASVSTLFFQQIADRQVTQGLAKADDVPLLLADMTVNGVVVGQPIEVSPKRTVTVRREVTPDDTLPATVVSMASPVTADIALLKIEKQNQPLVRLVNPADLKPGVEVVTVSYPVSGDAQVRPTAQLGSLAQTEPALLAYAAPGDPSPGGPVLTLDGDVVGVLSQHQPATATDVLGPISALVDDLERNKVTNGLAPLDQFYRDGLDAYYDSRYTDAIEKFDAVLAVIPSHTQAHDFRDRAQALRDAEGGGRPADSGVLNTVQGWLSGALGPIAVAALLAGLTLVLVRRRGHVREAPPAAPAARVRLATPTYCTNCSNALPDSAATCPTCNLPVATNASVHATTPGTGNGAPGPAKAAAEEPTRGSRA